MKLTKEQQNILQSTGDIKINAVAGSGKTTTIILYAKSRPPGSHILYLAFNRSVKLEAIRKFAESNVSSVHIETAHSLAYKHIVTTHQYRVKSSSYKLYEVVEMLNLKFGDDITTEYIIANHILKFVSNFCNSTAIKIENFDYPANITDPASKQFVMTFYKIILKKAIELYELMKSGEIEVTHDFYLKQFQLSDPQLPYDYILFDEGQDASPVMFDVILKQRAIKVVVGDVHQQIYSWRSAVNSMEKVDFSLYNLSTSFRFRQDIADLAAKVLKCKSWIQHQQKITISGKGNCVKRKTRAILARTNLGLLLRAIEVISEQPHIRRIYFEGNINSYMYGEDGTSLYDVLNLFLGKNDMVRDAMLKKMPDFSALEAYISKTEDIALGMMAEIVKRFKGRIPGILQRLKQLHVPNEERETAQIIFSTVHRAKGMEYDVVQLVNDFITEQKVAALCADKTSGNYDERKLVEEVNLLYVAITRVKNKLVIPEKLLPEDVAESESIVIEREEISQPHNYKLNESPATFVGYRDDIQQNAYKPWNVDLDHELTILYCDGMPAKDIATRLSRSVGAIRSRIKKLQLEEIYGD